VNNNLLRARIVEKGKTQGEIAVEIGISPMSLSRKLTGKREFHLSEIVNLCKCLDIKDPCDIFLPELSQKRNEKVI
jgi:transcriptional regulator with XRE-family HTH domain